MDYNKHDVINVSETSSDENNQGNSSEKFKETSVGRTYDCNFCRRGFTNAQALGGHMNIHRKDKAKANPKTSTKSKSSPSSLNRSNINDTEFLNSSNYFVPISIEQAQYYHAANYQLYYPVSSHSYPPQHSYIYPSDLNDNVASTEIVKMEEEILEANLSLEIGSSHMEDSKRKSTSEADEIDLELRL